LGTIKRAAEERDAQAELVRRDALGKLHDAHRRLARRIRARHARTRKCWAAALEPRAFGQLLLEARYRVLDLDLGHRGRLARDRSAQGEVDLEELCAQDLE